MYVPNDVLARVFDESDDLSKHVLPHVCVAFRDIAASVHGITPGYICTGACNCSCIECTSAQWPFTDVNPYYYDMCLHAAEEDCFDILQWAVSVGYALHEDTCFIATSSGNLAMTLWAVENDCYLNDSLITYAVQQNHNDIVIALDQKYNCITTDVMYTIIAWGNLELLRYVRSRGFTFEDHNKDYDCDEMDLTYCTVECFAIMIKMGYDVKEIIRHIMRDRPAEIAWLRRYYLATDDVFETAVRQIMINNRVDEMRWLYAYHPDRLNYLFLDVVEIVMYCQREKSADVLEWIIDHVDNGMLMEIKRVAKSNSRMRFILSMVDAKLGAH